MHLRKRRKRFFAEGDRAAVGAAFGVERNAGEWFVALNLLTEDKDFGELVVRFKLPS